MLAGLAVAAHLFNPVDWPPLGIRILHALHGPGFAFLALFLYSFLQSYSRTFNNYYIAAVAAAAIGLVSEVAQIPGPRDAQLSDLLIDGLGIVGALGVRASLDKFARAKMSMWMLLALPVSSGIALGIACIPPVWYGYALLQQQRQFPELLNFEASWEQATLSRKNGEMVSVLPNPPGWSGRGNSVAYLRAHGRWRIYLSLHPLPNWRDYSQLSFRAASTSDANISMAVCIRDISADQQSHPTRYCEDFYLGPRAENFTVFFSEVNDAIDQDAFNFSNVQAVVFSASSPGAASSIWLDNVRLEN